MSNQHNVVAVLDNDPANGITNASPGVVKRLPAGSSRSTRLAERFHNGGPRLLVGGKPVEALCLSQGRPLLNLIGRQQMSRCDCLRLVRAVPGCRTRSILQGAPQPPRLLDVRRHLQRPRAGRETWPDQGATVSDQVKQHPTCSTPAISDDACSLNGPHTGRRSGLHGNRTAVAASSEESDKVVINGDGQQLVVSLVSATLPTT